MKTRIVLLFASFLGVCTNERADALTVYLGSDAKNEIAVSLYELPPVPPAGVFDHSDSGWSCGDPMTAQRVALDPGYFPGTQEPLGVVSDGSGGVYLLWDEYAGQLTDRCRIQHLNAAGDRLWLAEGIIVHDAPYTERPQLASDGAGGVFVVHTGPDVSERLQRFDSAGNRLFGPQGVVLVQCCNQYPWSEFIADGTGGVFYLWVTWDEPQTVRVHHVDANGTQLWGGHQRRAGRDLHCCGNERRDGHGGRSGRTLLRLCGEDPER